MRSCLEAEKCARTLRQREQEHTIVRVRDAWYCQPCGQSLASFATGGAGRAMSRSMCHVGQSLQPWSCKVRCACAASAKQCVPAPASDFSSFFFSPRTFSPVVRSLSARVQRTTGRVARSWPRIVAGVRGGRRRVCHKLQSAALLAA